MGNPAPNLLWYLNGFPVNDSTFSIGKMFQNEKRAKSTTTANQQQLKDLFQNVRSTNMLRSASQQYCLLSFEEEIPSERQASSYVMMLVLIAAVAILLVLLCALLFVIRTKKSQQNLPMKFSCKCDTHAVSMSHLQIKEDQNEASNPTEDDIYVNTDALRQAANANRTMPGRNTESFEPEKAERTNKSSEEATREGGDVAYSLVTWKSTKGTVGKGGNVTEQPESYYLLERSLKSGKSRDFVSTAMEMGHLYEEVGLQSVKRRAECEYAQVNLKNKNAM